VKSAADFWSFIVEPDLAAYHNERSAAAVIHVLHSLWGCWEWMAKEQGRSRKPPPSDELQWLQDLAESAKHRDLNKDNRSTENLDTPSSGAAGYDVGGGHDDPSTGYGNNEPEITLTDGRKVNFREFVDTFSKQLQCMLNGEGDPA
jgi:hypothetical protein